MKKRRRAKRRRITKNKEEEEKRRKRRKKKMEKKLTFFLSEILKYIYTKNEIRLRLLRTSFPEGSGNKTAT